MTTSPSFNLTPWYVRLGGALAIGLVLAGLLYASSQLEPSRYVWQVLPCFSLATWTVWEANAWLTNRLDRRYPWSTRPLVRAGWQTLGCLGLTLLVTMLPYSLYKWYSMVQWERPGSRYSLSILGFVSGLALLLGVLVTALHLRLHFLGQWRAAELTRERLLREGTQARLAALNGHLNPHFLFNSFNVLAAMLDEQQAGPRAFIAQFVQLYRYILTVKDQEAVPLADELAGVAPYSFMLTQRFAQALRIELPGADALAQPWLLPPLCVQMLVENAVRHNVMAAQAPLYVRIGLEITPEGPYLVVENNYQPRSQPPAPGRPTSASATTTFLTCRCASSKVSPTSPSGCHC